MILDQFRRNYIEFLKTFRFLILNFLKKLFLLHLYVIRIGCFVEENLEGKKRLFLWYGRRGPSFEWLFKLDLKKKKFTLKKFCYQLILHPHYFPVFIAANFNY